MRGAIRVLLVPAIAAICSTATGVDRYVVVPLEPGFGAAAINGKGEIAGTRFAADGGERAVLWSNGTMTDLGTLGGATSRAWGLNDAGHVVGSSETARSGRRAFLYSNGVMKDIGTLPNGLDSEAMGINARGQVVGYADRYCGPQCPLAPDSIVRRAFVFENGVMTDLGTLGGDWSVARAVNDNGEIAGDSGTAAGTLQPFIYRNGVMSGLTARDETTFARDINVFGHVVGYGCCFLVGGDGWAAEGPEALLWAAGLVGLIDGQDEKLSEARAINNRDQVVGRRYGRGSVRGFLWEAGRSVDLNALLLPGSEWHIEDARAINDQGQILAAASMIEGTGTPEPAYRAVLLDPVLAMRRPQAIEYHHTGFNHYFVTSLVEEIAALDAGAFSGWRRTGLSFDVFPPATANTVNTCRFWSGDTFAPRSSHFYTPLDWECAIVQRNADWMFEGHVFALRLPGSRGECEVTTAWLYRLYNDGRGDAPNHRYTTSPAIRADMVAAGWIPEGYGSQGVIGCVPAE